MKYLKGSRTGLDSEISHSPVTSDYAVSRMGSHSDAPRLCMVVHAFPQLSETFIVSKFLGLLQRGWDVIVVCRQSQWREWERFPELAAQHRETRRRVWISWPVRPRWLARLLAPLSLARCMLRNPRDTVRYLRRGWTCFGVGTLRRFYLDAELILAQPDLIHFEFAPFAVDSMHLKDLLDSRVVVSFRGYDLNYVGLDNPGYYDDVWCCADALHLLGEDLWQRAQRRGCPPDKTHALIPPAIDTASFDPGERRHTGVAGTPESPLRILSVGRTIWKKGYEYALQAVQLLVDWGVHCEYRIIGDGDYLDAVAFAQHQLGLKAIVQLFGAQPRSEVRAQMLWADVFLHAAVSEGFCNAVMEAQAMSLPVVCTDADGLPENVANGETGFVVPHRDPQSMAEKLALLARDPDLRQRMGQAGRKRVLTHFQLPEQIERFGSLYSLALS